MKSETPCEAMVMISDKPERWTQCGRTPSELHHKLTRSRGGKALDKLGETYHHIQLCHDHHMWAHSSGFGYSTGLIIAGYFKKGVYTGPDEYLTNKYGAHLTSDKGSVGSDHAVQREGEAS